MQKVKGLETTIETMTEDQRSLLLYLEARAVDGWGKVDLRHMNDDDNEQAERWAKLGFIQWGRIQFHDIKKSANAYGNHPPTHWVVLSEDAWREAHRERRARAERTMAARTWKKAGED